MISRLHVCGRALIEVRRNGVLVLERRCSNFISELGDVLIADAMCDRAIDLPSHMAIGSGTGRVPSSTEMSSEEARAALTSTTRGSDGDDNVVTYVANFGSGVGTGIVSEIALFNDASAGTMFNYLDSFSPFEKEADFDITVTLSVRYGSST